MHSRKGIYFTAASLTFLLISGMPDTIFSTTATFTSIENIRVYLVIAVFVHVNIIYK